MDSEGITFISTLKVKRLESQIIQSIGGNKTKGPKQDSQNQLRSPMPDNSLYI
jgi:hypothetical protein